MNYFVVVTTKQKVTKYIQGIIMILYILNNIIHIIWWCIVAVDFDLNHLLELDTFLHKQK